MLFFFYEIYYLTLQETDICVFDFVLEKKVVSDKIETAESGSFFSLLEEIICFAFPFPVVTSCCESPGVSHLVSKLFLWAGWGWGYPKAADSHRHSVGPEGVSAPHWWQWHLLVLIWTQKRHYFLLGWETQTPRLQCLGSEGIVRLQVVLIDTDFAICGFILLPAPCPDLWPMNDLREVAEHQAHIWQAGGAQQLCQGSCATPGSLVPCLCQLWHRAQPCQVLQPGAACASLAHVVHTGLVAQLEQRRDSKPKILKGTGNSCDLHSRTVCSSQQHPAEHREKGPSHWSIFSEGSWWQMWHNPEILCTPPTRHLKIHNVFQSTYHVSCLPDGLGSVRGALSRAFLSSPISTTLPAVSHSPSSASLCVIRGLLSGQASLGLWHMQGVELVKFSCSAVITAGILGVEMVRLGIVFGRQPFRLKKLKCTCC